MRRPPFTPLPLRVLLGRIAHEWETRHRIFDLPTGRFYQSDPAHDLSVEMGGRQAATPVGPAAGPHTQLAQNFVLAWLAGARVFECKTVQVLDRLDIDRPCIEMAGEGYNVEWSQELPLSLSLREYVKAWMILDVLRRWSELWPVVGRVPGAHVFDISVGYDLQGIRSTEVAEFIGSMVDASMLIDDLREEIPDAFGMLRAHRFDPRIATTATVSTFHGCPPDEIEAIARHLMDAYGLDVVVKLNPTLLGHDTVSEILQRDLSYDDVSLDRRAFETDLQFERAVTLVPELARYAAERGRRFGIKLTNTLVVENRTARLSGRLAYLSGAPLHVLAVTLLDRLVDALPGVFDLGLGDGHVQVSWSAGVDGANFPTMVGLGLRPVTVCSDLLKPGGYGHLATMLKNLNQEMTSDAVTDIEGWVAHRHAEARAAGHRDGVASYAAEVRGPEGVRRYGAARVRRRLRTVDHDLELWGCVACNVCVSVCPNDAILHLRTPEGFPSDDSWQYVCLAELCNECGNCETFCPETGAPWLAKPRIFFDEGRFAADPAGRPAYLVEPVADGFSVSAAPGFGETVDDLRSLIEGTEGLPIRPEDLSASVR